VIIPVHTKPPAQLIIELPAQKRPHPNTGPKLLINLTLEEKIGQNHIKRVSDGQDKREIPNFRLTQKTVLYKLIHSGVLAVSHNLAAAVEKMFPGQPLSARVINQKPRYRGRPGLRYAEIEKPVLWTQHSHKPG
jgi:hypothetical protein